MRNVCGMRSRCREWNTEQSRREGLSWPSSKPLAARTCFSLSVFLLFACPSHGGRWDGSCSEDDRKKLYEQVSACPVSLVANTAGKIPKFSDLRTQQRVCAPGCSCRAAMSYTSLTLKEDSACASGCCTPKVEVQLLDGAIFVQPGILCRHSPGSSATTSCDCTNPKCRYRCDSIVSMSCLAQMKKYRATAAVSTESPAIGAASSDSGRSSSSSGDTNSDRDVPSDPESTRKGEKNSNGASHGAGLSTLEIVGISIGSVSGLIAAAVGAFALIVQMRDRNSNTTHQTLKNQAPDVSEVDCGALHVAGRYGMSPDF